MDKEQGQRQERVELQQSTQQRDFLSEVKWIPDERVRPRPHQCPRLRNDAKGTAQIGDDNDHQEYAGQE
jgi:hypothetical protein